MTIPVPVTPDTTVEPDETLTVTLSNGENLRIGNGTGTGTIGNDDFELSIVESRQGPERGSLVFPVTVLGGGAGRTTVTVEYATADLTATEPADYGRELGTLTFPTGVAEQSITVDLVEDDLGETDEQFEVVLSNPMGAVMTAAKSTATILDDDQPEITAADARGPEDGGPLGFAVSPRRAERGRGHGRLLDQRVDGDGGRRLPARRGHADVRGGADLEDHPGNVGGRPLAGGGRGVRPAAGSCDVRDRGGEPRLFSSFVGGGCVRGGHHRETTTTRPGCPIADDEAAEAGGELAFVVTATNLDDPNVTATVLVATSGTTATADVDYEEKSETLTFTSTDPVRTFTVTVLDDRIDEPNETLAVTLTDQENAELEDAAAVGTINDDDETSSAIALTAAPQYLNEGNGAKAVVVTANAGRQRADRVDDGGRVGDGEWRGGRGRLRAGPRLRDHHRGGGDERHGHVHPDAERQRRGRDGRNGLGRRDIRPAGDRDDGGAGRRRRAVDGHRALGQSEPGRRGRRSGAGGGHRDAERWRRNAGEDGGRDGRAKRRRGGGGIRAGARLRDRNRWRGDERHGHVHPDAARQTSWTRRTRI